MQEISVVLPASWQYSLQYLSPSFTLQLQDGCAHSPFLWSAINTSYLYSVAISVPCFAARPDKCPVTDFLETAGRIFETAASADGAELESGALAILIGQDGAIHMVMGTDWPLDSLQTHHGARAAYRVSRDGSRVRVEGKSRTASCSLQSEPPSLAARRLLADRPRYILAA